MTGRSSYRQHPELADRVFDLLERTFPGVGQGRANAERFGVPWEAGSTPFVVESGGRVLAHVGLLEMPLRIVGSDRLVGGVHGVATDREHRRRGLFRRLLEELIDHASDRYQTLILTTLHPEYFTDFGFRVVPESVGEARVRSVPILSARHLDLRADGDLALLHQLIETRTPVSDRLGVGPEKCCWGFVEFEAPIRYADSLGIAVVGEVVDRTLRVYDLIGPRVPSLEEIVAIWGEPVNRALLFVTPDRIAGDIHEHPGDLTGGPDALEPGTPNWVLMTRGPLVPPTLPVILPRPARC